MKQLKRLSADSNTTPSDRSDETTTVNQTTAMGPAPWQFAVKGEVKPNTARRAWWMTAGKHHRVGIIVYYSDGTSVNDEWRASTVVNPGALASKLSASTLHVRTGARDILRSVHLDSWVLADSIDETYECSYGGPYVYCDNADVSINASKYYEWYIRPASTLTGRLIKHPIG